MGKGDRKSKKGKLFTGSYGVVRPRKNNTPINNTEKKKSVDKKTIKKKKKATKKK